MDKQEILSLNKMRQTETYFKKHFLDLYNEISKLSPTKFQEKIYWYCHDLKDYPRCPCGNHNKFISILQGYTKYCSSKCSNSNPDKIKLTKEVNLKKYGSIAPAGNEDVKNKMKQTCIDKYGTEWGMQSKEIQERAKKTNMERHGVEWNGSIPGRYETQKRTLLEKYGSENYNNIEKNKETKYLRYGDPYYNNSEQAVKTQRERYNGVGNESPILKEKQQNTFKNNFINQKDFLIGYTPEGDWICRCPHPECNKCAEKFYITPAGIRHDRIRSYSELCTKLLPIQQTHSSNTTIELFIQHILDKNNIKYETNVKILDKQEIDIYIPEKKIGIECNGIYWHSDKNKKSNYHINKFLKAQEQGIQLIQIWEDWIRNKPEIVESILLSKLGISKTIYARNCTIQNVNGKISTEFLEKNHIQGWSPSQERYGLYYKGELVCLMCFTKNTGCQGNKNHKIWTLNRFCNKIGYRVLGGASKLLKYFQTYYPNEHILSFSYNDISDGGLYEVLGFKKDTTQQSYYYISPDFIRYHRSTFTKDAIVGLGWKENKEGWTEREVMDEKGFYRIYDSGTTRWVK